MIGIDFKKILFKITIKINSNHLYVYLKKAKNEVFEYAFIIIY